jgi:hypothetical protein
MMFETLTASMGQLIRIWADAKFDLEQSVPFSSGWFHLIGGPVIFMAAALVMRKPLSSWWPWLVVFLIAILNEFIDLAIETWPRRAVQYGESVSDLLLTIGIPTVMLISARRFSVPIQEDVDPTGNTS